MNYYSNSNNIRNTDHVNNGNKITAVSVPMCFTYNNIFIRNVIVLTILIYDLINLLWGKIRRFVSNQIIRYKVCNL